MSENFPSDLLEPLGPLTLSEVTFAAEDATAARMMPAPTSDAKVGGAQQPTRAASAAPSALITQYGSGCDTLGVLLSLQSFLTGAAIDARQWTERGGVGLCVMALTASCESVRSVGYDCLGRIMGAMDGGQSFAERRQVARLLLSLRDAVTTASMRIPAATASFVTHGLRVLLRPLHPQYKPLNSYVVSRPYFSLDEVPMFFDAFHGGGSRAREERIWLLQLLARSTRTQADLKLLKRPHALQLVMSLHDSLLSDAPTRRACLSVLLSAARIHEGARSLLIEYGVACGGGGRRRKRHIGVCELRAAREPHAHSAHLCI